MQCSFRWWYELPAATGITLAGVDCTSLGMWGGGGSESNCAHLSSRHEAWPCATTIMFAINHSTI
jgi:hypothetical protein